MKIEAVSSSEKLVTNYLSKQHHVTGVSIPQTCQYISLWS